MTRPPPFQPVPGLEELMPRFVAEMVADTAVLRRMAEGPRQPLAEHAHAMRGKCAMFGDECLFDILTRLEQAAGTGCAQEIADLVAAVVERTRQLEEYGTG